MVVSICVPTLPRSLDLEIMSIDVSFVRNLPPSLLGILPSAPPPPGVVPDFENPQTLVPVILAVESVFTAIALIVFFIRIYTKSVILRSWKWDDCKWSEHIVYPVVPDLWLWCEDLSNTDRFY